MNAQATTAAGTAQFTIGAEVSCTDGACGKVTRVIIDPIANTLTHIVVDPQHGASLGRLVPLDLVASSGDQVELSCSTAELDRLEAAEESEYLPANDGYGGYRAGHVLLWPYYGYGGGIGMGGGMGSGGVGIGGMGIAGMGMGGMGGMGGYQNGPQEILHDTVPPGEVSVRRGDPVHASDGDVGHVAGLVVDTSTHHVSHVLLKEGHLWGRKDVAIPIGALTRVGTVVEVGMTKHELAELPPIDIDHPQATSLQ